MNERIKQLALEAGMGPWGVGNGDNVSEIVEKFAELIVQECVGVADTYIQTGDHARPTSRSTIGRLIKEHFGVEE